MPTQNPVPEILLGAFGVYSLIIGILITRKTFEDFSKPLGFMAIITFYMIFPVKVIGEEARNHYLYTSILGLCGIVYGIVLIRRQSKPNDFTKLMLFATMLVLIIATAIRILQWKTPIH
jgi:hypothetical protein